jgi:hypothetical protein
MRTIEEIVADAQSAIAASLREAFDAGRRQQTTEMREKFVTFFEGVIAPFSGAPAAEAAVEAAPEREAPAGTEAASANPPAEAPAPAKFPADTPSEAAAEPASAA